MALDTQSCYTHFCFLYYQNPHDRKRYCLVPQAFAPQWDQKFVWSAVEGLKEILLTLSTTRSKPTRKFPTRTPHGPLIGVSRVYPFCVHPSRHRVQYLVPGCNDVLWIIQFPFQITAGYVRYPMLHNKSFVVWELKHSSACGLEFYTWQFSRTLQRSTPCQVMLTYTSLTHNHALCTYQCKPRRGGVRAIGRDLTARTILSVRHLITSRSPRVGTYVFDFVYCQTFLPLGWVLLNTLE